MITVVVTFKISDELDADILKEKFIETSIYIKMFRVLEEKIISLILRIILLVVFILLIVCKMLKIGLMKIGLIGLLIDIQNQKLIFMRVLL